MTYHEKVVAPSDVVNEIQERLKEVNHRSAVLSRFYNDERDGANEFQMCHRWASVNMEGNTANYLDKREIIAKIILGCDHEIDDSLMERNLYYVPLVKDSSRGFLRAEKKDDVWVPMVGRLEKCNTDDVKSYFTRSELGDIDYRYNKFAVLLEK